VTLRDGTVMGLIERAAQVLGMDRDEAYNLFHECDGNEAALESFRHKIEKAEAEEAAALR
jgi:hypothetical protein